MIKETLRSLGFYDREIETYLTALSLGSTTVSVISKRTKIPRGTTHYICQELVKKGLLTMVEKGNTFIFSPEPPEKLLNSIEYEEKTLHEKKDQVNRIVGELRGMMNPHSVLPKVRFYEGVDGLKTMFEDALKHGIHLYGILAFDTETHPDIMSYLKNIYTKKRIELGNSAHALFNDNEITREYRKNDKKVKRISMLLPKDNFPFSSNCHIYDNKIAFYSTNKNDLTGVLIENQLVRETQFSVFKAAWNYAKLLKVNTQYKDINI